MIFLLFKYPLTGRVSPGGTSTIDTEPKLRVGSEGSIGIRWTILISLTLLVEAISRIWKCMIYIIFGLAIRDLTRRVLFKGLSVGVLSKMHHLLHIPGAQLEHSLLIFLIFIKSRWLNTIILFLIKSFNLCLRVGRFTIVLFNTLRED